MYFKLTGTDFCGSVALDEYGIVFIGSKNHATKSVDRIVNDLFDCK